MIYCFKIKELQVSRILISFAFMVMAFATKAFGSADSLKNFVVNQKDSVQVDTYINIARYYFRINRQPDSMIRYAQLALNAAQKYQLIRKVLKTKKILGLAYIEAGNNIMAKSTLNEGLSIAKKANQTAAIIELNETLGYLYGKENDLEKSAYYYLNSATEYEKIKDYQGLGLAYNNIVVIFTLQDQYKKVLYYTEKALELVPKFDPQKDADMLISIYRSATEHYYLVAEKEKRKDLKIKSLVYADSCLALAKRYNISEGLSDAHYIIGYDLLEKKEFENAMLHFNKALENKKSLNDRGLFNIYSAICRLNLDKKDYRLCRSYLDTIALLPTSKELDGPLLVNELEYTLYKQTGDFEKALKAHENLLSERHKMQNNERNKTINDLEGKYQSELKEAKIVELSQQNEIDNLRIRSLIGISLAIGLLLLVIVFFYRQSTIKNKIKTMETEQRLNRARMNPHFFFNALTSLQTMSLSNSDQELLPSYISKFSKIMRQSLESTYHELDSIENEIGFLTDYLDLQKLRSESRFSYHFTIDDDVDISDTLMPGMILQPFIENAIEHGFKNIGYEGHIELNFLIKNNLLQITVNDNGRGIKDDEKHKTYPSRATQIIRDRLYLLNKQYKTNANFVFVNEGHKTGTCVLINLPLIYKS